MAPELWSSLCVSHTRLSSHSCGYGGQSAPNSRSRKLPCVLSTSRCRSCCCEGCLCWWTILAVWILQFLSPKAHLPTAQVTSKAEENAPQSLEIRLLLPSPLFFPEKIQPALWVPVPGGKASKVCPGRWAQEPPHNPLPQCS